MEMLKAIAQRRAYRAIKDEPLPEGALDLILEAGTLAPSCFNNQPWRVVAAEGDSLAALKGALAEGNAWAARAPAILAVAAREGDDCRLEDGRDYALFDAGLCAMNMMTQASALGLVAHPMAGYNPKKAKAALSIPSDYILITLIALGVKGLLEGPDASLLQPWQIERDRGPRQRKALAETAFKGAWGRGWGEG